MALKADRHSISINGDPTFVVEPAILPPWDALNFRVSAAAGDPAPLYIRAADAAPARDVPPVILDDA